MKTFAKIIVSLILVASVMNATGPATYYWVGGNGTIAWADGSTWNTVRGGSGGSFRTSPQTSDILIIDGTDLGSGATGALIITGVVTQTVGQLQLTGNATVNLQGNAAATVLTIGGGAASFVVPSGSTLNINGSNTTTIAVATGSTGSISGTMAFSGAAHKLTAADASGITFNSGSSFTQGASNSGNIFGTGTANSIIFASGSTFVFTTGSNPFALTAPASVVVFQSGSTYSHQSSNAPSLNGRTYSNFVYNVAATNSGTGILAFSMDNLTVSLGVFNVNLTGIIGIKGNISVASGATLTFNPAATSADSIIFNGSSPQSISNSGTLTFGTKARWTVNNSNGVTLSSSVTLNDSLILVNGNLSTGSNTLTLGSSAILTGETTGRYVIGNISNTQAVGTGASTFSGIGVSLDAGGGDNLGSVTVTRVSGPTGALTIGGKTGINRSWTAILPNANPNGRNLTLSWVTDDNNSKDLTTAQVWSTIDGGTTWNVLGTQQDISLTSPPTIVNPVLSPSPINVTMSVSDAANPLPVEMASFTAKANRLTAELHWSTASEVNSFGFDVERKSSNGVWAKIGFVAGSGTSTSLHNYAYSDNVGEAGMYEYRIKQIDKNGGFKYSSTMQVEVGAVAKVFSFGANYPNPFNPTTNIEFTVPNDGKVVLKVYNMLGQEVATLFDGEATAGRIMKTSFDASRLSSGVYFSRLEMAGQALVKRMVFMK